MEKNTIKNLVLLATVLSAIGLIIILGFVKLNYQTIEAQQLMNERWDVYGEITWVKYHNWSMGRGYEIIVVDENRIEHIVWDNNHVFAPRTIGTMNYVPLFDVGDKVHFVYKRLVGVDGSIYESAQRVVDSIELWENSSIFW